MAFGISPKYIMDMPLNDISEEQFLVYGIDAAKYLDWEIGLTSEKGFIAYSRNGIGITGEEISIRLQGTNAILKSKSFGGRLTDWGKNKKNIDKFLESFDYFKSNIQPEQFPQKAEELKQTFVSNERDIFAESPLTANENMDGILSIFKPVEGYFITPILININIGVFIAMVLSGVSFVEPTSESLLKWGANFGPSTLNGEWWRLLTCCFVHAGIFHILFNMYALIYIGLMLEPRLGKMRFTAAYLIACIGSSLTSLWWNTDRVSIGASGAIFGLYGVFLAMLTTNLIEKTARRALLTSIVVFVGYNLLNGLKGGIDNAAHIGGLITGLVIGYAYYPGLTDQKDNSKYMAVGLLSAAMVVFSFVMYHQIPNDIGTYEQKMKLFGDNEDKALEVYRMPEHTPNDTIYDLMQKGISYWQEDLRLIEEMDRLDIPKILHDRDKKIERYCELRLNIYELSCKTIKENTDQYKPQINELSDEAKDIISELSKPPDNK